MHGAFTANQNRTVTLRPTATVVFAMRQNLTSAGLNELMIDKFGLALL
jgi:hypothetical protein